MQRLGRTADNADKSEARETHAAISGRVLSIGKGILVAVIMLIVLGQLYGTAIVASPHSVHNPTDRVINESHTVAAGDTVSVNVSADYYYDSDPSETVYNATSGAELTEGTDYEWYTNGTLENLQASSTDFNVSYSYYQENQFLGMIDTFSQYGTTAFTMIGLGLIAAGAAAALAYFGLIGGGSTR